MVLIAYLRRATRAATAGVILTLTASTSAAIGFTTLGPGTKSNGLSGDGTTVIGDQPNVRPGLTSPFIWHHDTGFETVPEIFGRNTATLTDLSIDGTYILGDVDSLTTTNQFIFDSAREPGFDFPAGNVVSFADASYASTTSGAIVDLSNGQIQSTAFTDPLTHFAVSDGDVIAALDGGAIFASAQPGDLRFVGQIADLPGGFTDLVVDSISSNGRYVTGASESGLGPQAFLWSEAAGTIGLGDLPGGFFASNATDVSDDGQFVVGTGDTGNGPRFTEAFLWTEDAGMRLLADVLTNDYGMDLGNLILVDAVEIANDGHAITGNAWNPDTQMFEAYYVKLPEPSALILLLVGAAVIRRR